MLHVRSEMVLAVEPELPKKASHDVGPPPALLEFMVTEWEPRNDAIEALPEAARFRARREALSKLFPGEVLVVGTGHEKIRANDTAYRFRPGTDFYYLTGNTEPDCVLVMTPSGGGHAAVMYVEPNPGKTDASFFTDRVKGELWVGPRLGVPESALRYGLDARAVTQLAEDLDAAVSSRAVVRLLRGIDPALDGRLAVDSERDREFSAKLSEMRLIKDEYEIGELERAIESTRRGFEDVLRALPRSRTERHVEGVFNLRARVEGNDVGYSTIAAAGRHACTLHWTSNDGPVRPGELLLLDAGVEATTLYTADITRTVPIGGSFSREQREIYELVYAAQEAAFTGCAPGNDFMAPNDAAMKVLAHGLERLGILPMPAEEALLATNMFYKRYSLPAFFVSDMPKPAPLPVRPSFSCMAGRMTSTASLMSRRCWPPEATACSCHMCGAAAPRRFCRARRIATANRRQLAVDVIAFMDALKIEKAVIGGFDWGGTTADVIAANWPQRCKAWSRLAATLSGAASPTSSPYRRRPSTSGGTSSTSRRSVDALGYTKYRHDFGKLIWRLASPKWNFDDATFDRTAASFQNPDYVAIVIQ
jgi:Xaa-Pro aminopeptidase